MDGEVFRITIIAVLAFTLYGLWARSRKRSQKEDAPASGRMRPQRLYLLASKLYRHFEASAQPADIVQSDEFEQGVTLFNSSAENYTTQDLLAYYRGDNAIIACMALEALARRQTLLDVEDDVLSVISTVALWTRYFALRALGRHTPPDRPVVGRLLLKADASWTNRLGLQFLKEFVAERLDQGGLATFAHHLQDVAEEQGKWVRDLIERLEEPRLAPLVAELDDWERTRIDTHFLASIGRIWEFPPDPQADVVIEHEALVHHVLDLESALGQRRERSVLLVGESGVGKTAIVRALAQRMQQAGWVVFEATATELVAGQIFVGSLEQRLRNLVQQIGGKRRVLWFIPELHSLYWVGHSMHSETSALDFLLPQIEQGHILVLGETQPAAYERLLLLRPRCATALAAWRIKPLADTATLDLAREWGRRHTRGDHPDLLPEPTLREAWNLTQQYLGDQATPGNLLKLLDLTRKRLAAALPAEDSATSKPDVIQVDDLIVTLTQLTGLPESILDERYSLNLGALRELFEKRVLGQNEAIDCLVERVAMIKAGVTDPTRPQGVFLFAGPTGTGKTEIAKTLAEFLFGSPNRMIRFDMSELQTTESFSRLLGSPESKTDGALVDQIRKQPFSVVLLDEFEKAHPNVWDLFLQVFDDGRLTDRIGNTADFRHAIIIMTSNLGGVIPSGTSLGFAREGGSFRRGDVERAIAQAFRREFLNRIDRVVVFNPLTRETMREILLKELEEVTGRRGLRSRTWAIEWDDEAIEFLLVKGFTADLGARPLRRAIERYVLSPLAVTIVNHQFPAGDQFLFVKVENERLVVEFVDPAAAESAEAVMVGTVAPTESTLTGESEVPVRIERIAFAPRGTAAELLSLEQHFDHLRTCVEGETWQQSKLDMLSRTGAPGFWQSSDRFRTLGQAEYLDRIERGVRGAGSLLDRLYGSQPGSRERYSRDLVGRLAQQLYLLESACGGVREQRPYDAFLLVEAGREARATSKETNSFAIKLGNMYRAWGKKRRMQLHEVEEWGGDGARPYHLLLAVCGYAAYPILRLEDGLHVLEIHEGHGKGSKRCKVRVRVVPQPEQPLGEVADTWRRQAVAALRNAIPEKLLVVRRYREAPPLVRDRVRGWRSVRLERVLDGDFDLIVQSGSD